MPVVPTNALPLVAAVACLSLSACTTFQTPSQYAPQAGASSTRNAEQSGGLKQVMSDNVDLDIDIYAESDFVLLHTPYPEQESFSLVAYDANPVFVGNAATVSHIIERADANLVAGEYSQAMASYHKALEDDRATNWEQSYVQGQIAIIYLSNSPLRDVRKAQQRVKELSRALELRGESVPASETTILYAVENRLRLELEKLQLLRKLRQRKEAFLSLQEERALLQNALEKLRKLTLE